MPVCVRLRRKRDWCDGHYGRWKSTGDLREAIPLPPLKKSEICIVVGCDNSEHARKLCASHYNQTTGVSPLKDDVTVLEIMGTCTSANCNIQSGDLAFCVYHTDLDSRRSTEKFSISDILHVAEETGDGCWIHKNRSNDYGYNSIRVGARIRGIHRVSYAISEGMDVDEIPQGLVVMHKCDNPPCFNPDHLTLGTESENMQDALNKRRLFEGEDSHFSKLTDSDVIAIRDLFKKKASARQLSSQFNIHIVTIYDIINRKTWKHLSD